MPFQDLLALFLSGNQGYVPPSTEGPYPEDISALIEQIRRMQIAKKEPLAESVSQMQPDRGFGPLMGKTAAAIGGLFDGPDLGFDPKEKSPMQQEVLEKFAQVDERKSAKQAEAAETERMRKDAYERQLDPYSWLGGKGGADPAEKLQKLRRIREQAGGAGGGGTFSQQADSPELQARLRERDEWTAQQPMRDMEFLASAEQARRNPELAMSSAQRLSEMKSQQSQDRVIANQEALIAKLGKGGKVPFDLAMQLQASGMPVPFEMRGISPDRATQEIQQVMRGAQESIAAMIEDPSKMGMNGRAMISFLQWVIDSGPQFLQYAQQNPDEALARYEQMAQIYAQQTGALAGMALGPEPQQVE